jgi:hypothetical protein
MERALPFKRLVIGVVLLAGGLLAVTLLTTRPDESVATESPPPPTTEQQKPSDDAPAAVRTRPPAAAPAPPAEVAQGSVRVGPPLVIRCAKDSRDIGRDVCDHVEPLEAALIQAIQAAPECSPDDWASTIHYLLTVDIPSKTTRVTPGAAGRLKPPQAKAAAECVTRALPTIEWAELEARDSFYVVTVLAQYGPK